MAALQALAGKFTHLTVGKKLGLGFALLLLLAVVIAGTGAQYLHIIESRADRIDFSNRLNEEINQPNTIAPCTARPTGRSTSRTTAPILRTPSN